MAHYVNCVFCGKQFNRDKEETVQVSARRYAHKKCAEEHEQQKTQEERDLEALENYIKKIFNEPYVNARIKKQIKEYQQTYNYTYSGMLKTLIWWFEIKGNSIERANGGIGIIPYIYREACDYYYALYLAQLANKEKDVHNYIPREKIIEIASPRVFTPPPKLFNLEEDEDVK